MLNVVKPSPPAPQINGFFLADSVKSKLSHYKILQLDAGELWMQEFSWVLVFACGKTLMWRLYCVGCGGEEQTCKNFNRVNLSWYKSNHMHFGWAKGKKWVLSSPGWSPCKNCIAFCNTHGEAKGYTERKCERKVYSGLPKTPNQYNLQGDTIL